MIVVGEEIPRGGGVDDTDVVLVVDLGVPATTALYAPIMKLLFDKIN